MKPIGIIKFEKNSKKIQKNYVQTQKFMIEYNHKVKQNTLKI